MIESQDSRLEESPKVPTIRDTVIVVLFTVAIILFVITIFTVISHIYQLDIDTEFLLVEVMIIVPALLYGKVKGYSLRHIFRFNPIEKRQLFITIVIGISLILVVNFIEQSFPQPDWYNDLKSDFETSILETLTIDSFYKLVMLILTVVLFAAVCEEMLFRGFIQQSLENRLSAGSAIFLTAILFTVLHPFSIVPILVLALVLGFVSLRSNSIIPSIIIHGLNNGISLYALNKSEELRADPTLGLDIPVYIFILSLTALILSVRYYFKLT